jgi:hypothetical protein
MHVYELLIVSSCKNLLNNSTIYHLKSLIALPIEMIRIWGGGGAHPIPPQVSPLMITLNQIIVGNSWK